MKLPALLSLVAVAHAIDETHHAEGVIHSGIRFAAHKLIPQLTAEGDSKEMVAEAAEMIFGYGIRMGTKTTAEAAAKKAETDGVPASQIEEFVAKHMTHMLEGVAAQVASRLSAENHDNEIAAIVKGVFKRMVGDQELDLEKLREFEERLTAIMVEGCKGAAQHLRNKEAVDKEQGKAVLHWFLSPIVAGTHQGMDLP